eukprot:CAMPEP_0115553102 /NCGR_PEP_ID=MMETSP0271-20121206/96595_1 /TAXON_ID=71861 /ORGANISM="Scrippsiella trochoidea, Strain CCMP3099" /LENGTH=46 /DNA_ID= /DNA_START= /DNA_END= /DNA_ORIENTATION=
MSLDWNLYAATSGAPSPLKVPLRAFSCTKAANTRVMPGTLVDMPWS